MGLLVLGEPLSWRHTALLRHYVKYHGIIQFINAYNKHKHRKCDRFMWGDEIECLLLHLNPQATQVHAQLRANQILDELHQEQATTSQQQPGHELNITFHPEYGNNMLEVTPFVPYGGSILDLLAVETNMRLRRAVLQAKLKQNEFVIYACNFPLFGTPNFTRIPPENTILPTTPISTSTNAQVLETFALPPKDDLNDISISVEANNTTHTPTTTTLDITNIQNNNQLSMVDNDTPIQTPQQLSTSSQLPILGPILKSNYVPDCLMSPHPRFATLSGNIRRRRGKKVDIELPIYNDENTNQFINFPDGNIHSDAMGFGMGSCCLQVTFQTHSNAEARFLYDQMAILAPIFLSLTANTPFHRGHIVDTDVRWSTICQSVDDRTDEEKGINKSTTTTTTGQTILSTQPTPIIDSNVDIPELSIENPYLTHFRNKFNTNCHDCPDCKGQNDSTSTTSLTTTTPTPNDTNDKLPCSPCQQQQPSPSTTNNISPSSSTTSTPTSSFNSTTSNPTTPCAQVLSSLGLSSTTPPTTKLTTDAHISSLEFKCINSWASHNVGIPYNDLPISVTKPNTPNIITPPRIYKSRYSSIDCYINNDPRFGYHPSFNDIKFPYHEPSYELLKESGVDQLMAKHIASLWIRDPLVMFQGQIDQNDMEQTNHFESIQSTNWRSVRYKPPSHAENPGFRVEFRTMELNFTDFENAAFTVFIALLARAIVHFELDLYIPLSKVDDNFDYAHCNHSVLKQLFWFKSTLSLPDTLPPSPSMSVKGNCTPLCGATPNPDMLIEELGLEPSKISLTSSFPSSTTHQGLSSTTTSSTTTTTGSETSNTLPHHKLMSIDEIINGSVDFIGLVPIVQKYLHVIQCDISSLTIINKYLELISMRANGELLTGAQFQRQFIYNHPSYKQIKNSKLPEDAIIDLLMVMHGLSNQTCHIVELLGGLDPSLQLDPTTYKSSPLQTDLYNKPTINLIMNELLEQLNSLGNNWLQNVTPTTQLNKLQQIIYDNQLIINTQPIITQEETNSTIDSTTPTQPSEPILSTPPQHSDVQSTQQQNQPQPTNPKLNSRSNYYRLIENPHTSTLHHAFTVQQGEQQLELPKNLIGAKMMCMETLHGHPPDAGSQVSVSTE